MNFGLTFFTGRHIIWWNSDTVKNCRSMFSGILQPKGYKGKDVASMATIFAITSLELSQEEKKHLSDELIKDIGTLYTHAMSFNLAQIPQDHCRGGSINQTTFFVCVPPYMSIEKKRETIKLLNDTMGRVTGYQGELKVVVLFQYHDDEGVGKDGELFADIKARQAAEAAAAQK